MQKAAGALSIVAGILLLLAVPLTLLILGGVLGESFRSIVAVLDLYLVCGVSAHVVLAFGSFWGGYRAVTFNLESASTVFVLGVGSIIAGILLLGGVVGVLAGVLLLIAGALVLSS